MDAGGLQYMTLDYDVTATHISATSSSHGVNFARAMRAYTVTTSIINQLALAELSAT